MNKTFIKLNSSFLDHPDHFEFFKTPISSNLPTIPNFQRGFKIFEDSGYGEITDFIKERDGDNSGFHNFRFSDFTISNFTIY